MTRRRFVLPLLLSLTLGVRAEDYRETNTGIVFPEVLGAYRRSAVTPYQAGPDNSGVAIAYRAEDAELTVYVRRGAERGRTADDHLKAGVDAIRDLEARGQFANVKFYEFRGARERPGWKSAAFTARADGRAIVSFLHCTVASERRVKIRATCGTPKNEALLAAVVGLQETVERATGPAQSAAPTTGR